MRRMVQWFLPGIALGALLLAPAHRAEACGCFAIPSPATPVLQAGERILFAKEGNNVLAYIQVQYQGAADQFAWLIPLPSVPQVDIGTDELFTKLDSNTAPNYVLSTVRLACGNSGGGSGTGAVGCGASLSSGNTNFTPVGASDLGAVNGDIVVERASVGPYDYAVLKADNGTELNTWLTDNRYFVPTGTTDALTPYLRTGAYFLALKLRAGESVGDLVPVVLRYPSDMPMIPITLTSVGAVPHMGVLVYMLGEGRGVPTNYHHSVINDLPMWQGTTTLSALIDKAVGEAPQHHTFFTQFHGSARALDHSVDYSGRFGDLTYLATLGDPSEYLRKLLKTGFPFSSTMLAILNHYIPLPAYLPGVPALNYYQNYDFYSTYRQNDVSDGGAATAVFDPVALTNELNERIVKPSRAAQKLLDAHPQLTRLYTTLSPEDMNLDPVFGWNKTLPDVSNLVSATATQPCSGQTWVKNAAGQKMYIRSTTTLPASLRVEVLGQEGSPTVMTDNSTLISNALTPIVGDDTQPHLSSGVGCGCDLATSAGTGAGTAMLMVLTGLGLLAQRLRRRR